MNYHFDVVIIGSGPAGVHAAYPLIKAGIKVAIIDGGLDSKKQDEDLNKSLYSSFRETSNAYNLVKKSSYAFNKTYELLRIKSKIEIIQTLAKGGLTEQWHGICDFFTNDELEVTGLPAEEIKKEYIEVGKLIKLNSRGKLHPHSNLLLGIFRKKDNFNSILYQVPIAFSYRTSDTIDKLKRFKNFTYIPNQLVSIAKDKGRYVEVESFGINSLLKLQTTADYVILAAGSINTTRIILRSLNLFNYKTTFLTKSHFLTACIQPNAFMKKVNLTEKPVGQLVISTRETNFGLGAFFVQLYKFNPKAIHKIIKTIPLPKFLSSPLLWFLVPTLMVADIRFPAFESKNKFCRLIKRKDQDIMEISFAESGNEQEIHKREFRKVTKELNLLGLFHVKSTYDYTTSHYAGGVPYRKKAEKISVDINGKLHQTKRIYIADSASWTALPAKSPTLTIMANAARIGKKVLENFSGK